MKREFAALIGTAFLISAIPFQLMGWSVTAWVLGVIGVAAGWKSGYRIHVHTEEDYHRSLAFFPLRLFLYPG